MMGYRFGFDVGTNSIGWCVLELDETHAPVALIQMGTRIYSDGREPDGKSLNETRRLARGARRRRDRFLRRQAAFMQALIKAGLMPAEEGDRKALEALDPYDLRKRGLDETIPPHNFGRALFHLNQRRGFQSNRKADVGGDSESGKIKSAAQRLDVMIKEADCRTIGEFFANRHAQRESVRARLQGSGAKAEYAFYPTRAMIGAEFDALWARQSADNPALTHEIRETLRGILLTQRLLRPQVVGRCSLNHEDERSPWAMPFAQRFRILKELANLKVGQAGRPGRRLTMDERDRLLEKLLRTKEVSFDNMRKWLKLEADQRFNLEDDKRTGLKGDETALRLSGKAAFGKAWQDFSLARQTEIVERLLTEENEDAVLDWLTDDVGVSDENAQKISNTTLPSGHCRFGVTILHALIGVMQAQGEETSDPETGESYAAPMREDQAIALLGRHHSDRRDERSEAAWLPYYGEVLTDSVRVDADGGRPGQIKEKRYGRLTNPSVHIGLNQLRLIVNSLIKTYGKPAQIVIELARELKQSAKDRDEAMREQAQNQKRNDRHRQELAELGIEDNGENRLRLRLWEELARDPLQRLCVYSGRVVSKSMLFNGEIEVEHILPFRRTLDNGGTNKTLCLREWNRLKGDRSPWEAFHARPEWPDILARAQALPSGKRWRFNPDAMERYENSERNFLDRQLIDTQYLGRIAKRYMLHLYGSEDGDPVWVTPGRLTSLLRGKWGLDGLLSDHNRKNRNDHRHHAIDALVVACTDRSLLNRVAAAADAGRDRLIAEMPIPWPDFRDQVKAALARIIVSHRPDHGTQGALFEDTAYGMVDPAKEDGCNLVRRKPLESLSEKDVAHIRDRALRARLAEYLAQSAAQGTVHKDALAKFVQETGIRRVRILKVGTDAVSISDKSGKLYKALLPDENHHIDVIELPDGKWIGESVNIVQANQNNYVPATHPDARLIMQIHKGDLLDTEVDGKRKIVKIISLQISKKRCYVVGHEETGDFQRRDKDPDDPFGWNGWRLLTFTRMQQTKTRRVIVDALGAVRPVPPLGKA